MLIAPKNFSLALALSLTALPAFAQTPAVPPASAPAPVAPAPAAPVPVAPTPVAPETPPAADKSPAAAAAQAVDDAIKQEDLAARSVLELHGEASWEEGYAKINEAIGKLRAAADKAGLKIAGRPMAIFTDAEDQNFKFDAALPVEAAADVKPTLDKDVAFVQSPSGKALRFEHRGPYDDIDTTYEAITAYMDEKGLDAKNLFIEEYLNDPKDSGDAETQVDIHVFLK